MAKTLIVDEAVFMRMMLKDMLLRLQFQKILKEP
jgi:hypothetical protein